jgi:hypothetical protein
MLERKDSSKKLIKQTLKEVQIFIPDCFMFSVYV